MKPAMSWQTGGTAALTGAFFAAFAHLMVRKLNRYDNHFTIVFNFFACTALVSLLVTLFTETILPNNRQWLLIGGIALFARLGQFLMTLAYRCDIAPVVAHQVMHPSFFQSATGTSSGVKSPIISLGLAQPSSFSAEHGWLDQEKNYLLVVQQSLFRANRPDIGRFKR